ncbi:hypothetical protein ACJEMQ_19620, partial [Escherichia coli]
QKKLIMLPSETMIWQPEFTDKTLSRKPGAVHPIQLYCAKQKVEFYLTARKICISLFYHSYIFIQTINFFLIIMIKVLIVNRCRASGMEGGTPLFHMIPE